MVVIGSTGVGKSTLLNGILKGENLLTNPIFEASSDMDSCTSVTKDVVGNIFNIETLDPDFQMIRLVDTPGLNEGSEEDAIHISDMI